VNGTRTPPAGTGGRGTCPACGSPVVAKCGDFVAWHWAHADRDECDTWAEPGAMTAWHRGWQGVVPADRREVIVGSHRADVVLPDLRTVCEVQHSPLQRLDIEARQETYGADTVWIFDAR